MPDTGKFIKDEHMDKYKDVDWNEINGDAQGRMVLGERADETRGFYTDDDLRDKALFVAWLGELLSMTREGITRCYLADNDTVIVQWRDGYTKLINIAKNSRMAIIREVVNDEDLR